MSLNDVISSTEFQNRFGMHTKPFQELAAYILIMAREHTDLSVREVGEYVKNLMQEKHRLELDLAEAHSKFSTPAVQAALIAAQAEEIKRLRAELAAASGKLASRETEMPILVTQRDEAARLSHQYRNERDAFKAQVEQAEQNSFDTQNALKQECAEHKATKGALQAALDESNNRGKALVRFQNIARNTARVLRSIVDGIPPDIDTIEDGCIRLHLKQVLDRHQSRLDGAKLLVEERDSIKADLAREQEEHNRATTLHAETQKRYDVLRERFHSVMAELLPDHGPDADAYVDGHCDPVAHARRVATNQIPEGATCWNPEDSFHKLCIDACHEANRARGLFPKSDHLTLALAEEAGEVTKAVLDHRQGRCALVGVRKEIVQTMAMCLRLAAEGDPTVNLKRSQE